MGGKVSKLRASARLMLVLLLAAAGSPALAESDSLLQILVPVDGSVVRHPDFLLVCRTLPGVRLGVQLDGQPYSAPDTVVPEGTHDLHHLRVALEEGRHTLHLLDAGARMTLGLLAVTYIPRHSLRTATGKEDRAYWFHTREREERCRGCHNLPDPIETDPNQPLSPAGKVCGACHRDTEAGPNVHGPVAVYACFQCHTPQSAPARFAWAQPEGGKCESCHAQFLSRLLGSRSLVHGPVAVGVCTACHDPHSGQGSATLKEVQPGLCQRCHTDPLLSVAGMGPHGQQQCTACHDPHGAEGEFLVVDSGAALCGRCHENVLLLQTRGHPLKGHPVEAKVDPSRPGRSMTCLSCHGIHGEPRPSMAAMFQDKDARKAFCRKCHY